MKALPVSPWRFWTADEPARQGRASSCLGRTQILRGGPWIWPIRDRGISRNQGDPWVL